IIKLATFLSLDSHRGWCRYNSFADMVLMGRAATMGSVVVYAITAFSGIGAAIPRSVFMIDWAGTILALGCLRGGVRLFRESYYPRLALGPVQRVLVVGASDSELALVREIHAQPQLGLRVVGFLDESASARGRI